MQQPENYIRGKKETISMVGVDVGRPCLIEKNDEKFVVDVIYKNECAIEGLRMA